ncbi:uncharacterized protein Z519_04009 [Cladophialophora bantiana CBS 173.52]|uniref:DUF6594 domain-containing protein n=1 Tax=Cladophialophora bantiana (strain ATCC 10958 / CBS 173.52 / CDC B-1940 / NIH 8579) TaxID=1442370 RepID=A0A0D2HWX5_CLAB1|nr:uncharacterized protein Z519_04009 [Cladophialophora bantiana CBS 173.52]KIW95425.1 hypothetical protein Z519_04009 [Cladophialophora bantiana CBS 173.52]
MSIHRRFDEVPAGYAKLSAFIGKERNFTTFRKLDELDRSLNSRSQADGKPGSEDPRYSWNEFVCDSERRRLVEDIRAKLDADNSALLQCHRESNLSAPSRSHISGLKAWMNDANPIQDSSAHIAENRSFLGDRYRDDNPSTISHDVENGEVASLTTPADSWLARAMRGSFLKYVFMKDFIYSNGKEEIIYFFPGSKIDDIVTGVATPSAVMLIVVATIPLRVEMREKIVFTLLLAIVLPLCGAKKYEVVLGTAGQVSLHKFDLPRC